MRERMKLDDLAKIQSLNEMLTRLKQQHYACSTSEVGIVELVPIQAVALKFAIAKADPPSLVGALFHSVQQAVLNFLHVQILSTEAELRSLGVVLGYD